MRKLIAWAKLSKPVRSFRIYSQAGGNLLAAGMSFEAIFAVFAAVWVGFSVFGIYLHDHPDVQASVIDFINSQIPGLIQSGGPINPTVLNSITSVGWTGGLAIVVVLYTAINWLNYVRVAMRTILGLPIPTVNYVLLKIYDLLIALAYGFIVFLTAVGSVLITRIALISQDALGISDISPLATVLIQLGTLVVIVMIDAALIAAMIRIISAVNIPWKRLVSGSLLGGITLGFLKIGGAILINRPETNPLLASFAVLLGLLIYFNLASRIFLLTVSWIQVGLEDDGIEAEDLGWVVSRSKLASTT